MIVANNKTHFEPPKTKLHNPTETNNHMNFIGTKYAKELLQNLFVEVTPLTDTYSVSFMAVNMVTIGT